jgi:HEAT repeat protein
MVGRLTLHFWRLAAFLVGVLTLAGTLGADPQPSPEELADLVEDLVGDRRTRGDARRKLAAHGRVAVPHLIARARDPRFPMRWEVVNLLGELKAPEAIDTLIERIAEDADPHVRWRSMWAIKRIPEATIPHRLAAVCDEAGARGWNACVALSLFADPRALPRLRQGLTSPDDWVRWEAVDSLGRVHDEQTSRWLTEALDDPLERVRQEVVLSLAQIGDENALAALLEALEDPSSEVRWRAAMGLARRGSPKQLAALEQKLATERDANTRNYLEKAVERLRSTLTSGNQN